MIKVRVSYEHQEELKLIIEKLGSDIKKIKMPQRQEGRFKKAYIELKE